MQFFRKHSDAAAVKKDVEQLSSATVFMNP